VHRSRNLDASLEMQIKEHVSWVKPGIYMEKKLANFFKRV
jgi:hypothetical protein